MTNYIEFIKWCVSGVSLSDPITRIFCYLGLSVLGALVLGPNEFWPLVFALAVAVDLFAGMVAWKYTEFKREQRDAKL